MLNLFPLFLPKNGGTDAEIITNGCVLELKDDSWH